MCFRVFVLFMSGTCEDNNASGQIYPGSSIWKCMSSRGQYLQLIECCLPYGTKSDSRCLPRGTVKYMCFRLLVLFMSGTCAVNNASGQIYPASSIWKCMTPRGQHISLIKYCLPRGTISHQLQINPKIS